MRTQLRAKRKLWLNYAGLPVRCLRVVRERQKTITHTHTQHTTGDERRECTQLRMPGTMCAAVAGIGIGARRWMMSFVHQTLESRLCNATHTRGYNQRQRVGFKYATGVWRRRRRSFKHVCFGVCVCKSVTGAASGKRALPGCQLSRALLCQLMCVHAVGHTQSQSVCQCHDDNGRRRRRRTEPSQLKRKICANHPTQTRTERTLDPHSRC